MPIPSAAPHPGGARRPTRRRASSPRGQAARGPPPRPRTSPGRPRRPRSAAGAVLQRRLGRRARPGRAPAGPRGSTPAAASVPVNASSAIRPSAPCSSTAAMSLVLSCASPRSSYLDLAEHRHDRHQQPRRRAARRARRRCVPVPAAYAARAASTAGAAARRRRRRSRGRGSLRPVTGRSSHPPADRPSVVRPSPTDPGWRSRRCASWSRGRRDLGSPDPDADRARRLLHLVGLQDPRYDARDARPRASRCCPRRRG